MASEDFDRGDLQLREAAYAIVPTALGVGASFAIISIAGEFETIEGGLVTLLFGATLFFLSWMWCFSTLSSGGEDSE
ncbi:MULTISPECIES: hypothetical protein [Halobacterium]|uniref:hypothetical protein n=1 Tax=Halobacterium TaxID=2239 RepID=UPI00073E8112|nr:MULTISPECIES: hypothetical protein [Halobacterium]MCG1002841.1 hypothetical protein [Halobacterium noricense]